MTTTKVPESLYSKLHAIQTIIEHVNTTDGERAAAQEALARLLKNHNLTLGDLSPEQETTETVEFRIRFSEEASLVIQLIAVIQNETRVSYHRYWNRRQLLQGKKKLNRKLLGFNLTKAQKVQAELLIPYYLKAYRKSLKDYMEAFIQTNRLFPESATPDIRPLSKEEYERLQEISRMARGIRPVASLHPRLEVNS